MAEDSKILIQLGDGENSDSYSEFVGVRATSNTVPSPDGKSAFNRNGLAKYGALAPVLTGAQEGRIAYSRVSRPPNLSDGHVLLLGVNTSKNNAIVAGILSRPRGNVDGDSTASVLQFDESLYTVDPAETVTATVLRSGALDTTVTVAYATVAGSATAGTHYTATSGTLTFATGEASKTFTVATIDVGDVGPKSFSLNLSAPTGGAIIGSPNPAAVLIDYAEAEIVPMFLVDHADAGKAYMALYNASTDSTLLKVIQTSEQLFGDISSTNIFRISDSEVAITQGDGDTDLVLIYDLQEIIDSVSAVSNTSSLSLDVLDTLGGTEWSYQKSNSAGILYWLDSLAVSNAKIRRFNVASGTVLSELTVTYSLESGYSHNYTVLHGIDAAGYLILGQDQVNGSAHRYKIYRVNASTGAVDGTYLFTPTDFDMGATDTFVIQTATAGTGTNNAVLFKQEGETRLIRLDTWAAGTATKTTVSTGLNAGDVLLAQLGVFGNTAWAYNSGSLYKLENVVSGSFARTLLTGSFALGSGGNALGLPSPPGIVRISDTMAVGTYVSSDTDYFLTVDLTDGTVDTVTGSSVSVTRAVSWSGAGWLEANCQGAM